MSTKYAKARGIAYLWRAEHAKLKRENKSLRNVYATAKALLEVIATIPLDVAAADARFQLRDACRNAVFAVEGKS